MIESFRHLVDRSVFEVQQSIIQDDFIYSRDRVVVLSHELKENFIKLLTSILDRRRDYKARIGIRRAGGYQRMEEVTIMKMRCIGVVDFIIDGRSYKNKLYPTR